MELNEATSPNVSKTMWDTFSSVQRFVIGAGLIVVLAMVCMFLLWSWTPSYKMLFRSLDDQKVTAVFNALYTNGFDVRLDKASGAILVPSEDIHLARITLSSHGLPSASEVFNQNRSIGIGTIPGGTSKNSIHGKVEVTQRIENIISQRIEHFLEPLVGSDSVRAQVTIIQKDKPTDSNTSSRKKNIIEDSLDLSQQSTISLSENIGSDNRLNIVVIVDDKKSFDGNGNIVRNPRTDQEIEKFTDIVKTLVGYNKKRGDTINLINSRFSGPLVNEGIKENIPGNNIISIEQFKNGAGFALVIVILIFIIWKITRAVFFIPAYRKPVIIDAKSESDESISSSDRSANSFEENIHTLNTLVKRDPKLIAQILRNWVNADER